jgi:hypothetical protein
MYKYGTIELQRRLRPSMHLSTYYESILRAVSLWRGLRGMNCRR